MYFDTCVTFTGIRFFVYIETKIPDVIIGTQVSYEKNDKIIKSAIAKIQGDKYILQNGSSIDKTSISILNDICKRNGTSIGKSNNIIVNLFDELNSKQSKCITIYDIYEKFKTKYNNIMKDFEQKGKLDNNNYKDFYQQCVSEFKQLTLMKIFLKTRVLMD